MGKGNHRKGMRPERRKKVSQGDVVTQKSRTMTVPRRKGSARWNAVERSNKMMTEKYPPDLARWSFIRFLARADSVG